MEKMIERTRISWLDSSKGFAILLVVLGHIADGYLRAELFPENAYEFEVLHNLIYSFHMPLFFILSGYIFYRAYCSEIEKQLLHFKRQLFNIVWVYVGFSILQWIFKMFFSSNVNMAYTVKDLLLLPIKPMAPYWYLYIMLFFYMICYLVCKKEIKSIYVWCVAVAMNLTAQCVKWDVIFPMEQLLYFFVFFYLGVQISRGGLQKKMLLPFATAALLAIAYIIYAGVNLEDEKLFGFGALEISMTCILMFMNAPILSKSRLLNLCGRYSLEIYVMHCFITAANRSILWKFGLTHVVANVLVNFVMAVFIPILVAWILKKLGLHKIIFKFGNYAIK